MKCSEKETQPSDCSDKESVLKMANRVAERKFFDKIDNFQIEILEEADSYTVVYSLKDTLRRGGGGHVIISKKDCRVVDFKGYR